jgi:excisionase family DNA binding protein
MTVAEVAERLRVSEQTVYRLNRKGKLHGHSVSRRAMRFRTEEIDALIGATLGDDAEPQR